MSFAVLDNSLAALRAVAAAVPADHLDRDTPCSVGRRRSVNASPADQLRRSKASDAATRRPPAPNTAVLSTTAAHVAAGGEQVAAVERGT